MIKGYYAVLKELLLISILKKEVSKLIWNKEIEEYKLASINKDDISNAEQLLNVKLPDSYIKLMLEQNGGVPIHLSFPCEISNSWADDHVFVHGIYGIGEEGILQSQYLIEEWGLPNDVVLFSGDGHSWLAMDYRQTKNEPPIIWIDKEPDIIIDISNDFSSFIEGLYTATLEEVQIENMPFSIEKIEELLEQEDSMQWIKAFNMLSENIKGNKNYIQQKIIRLLNGESQELKRLAVHYTMIFNEKFSFSVSNMQTIYSLMEQDPALKGKIGILRNYIKQLKELEITNLSDWNIRTKWI